MEMTWRAVFGWRERSVDDDAELLRVGRRRGSACTSDAGTAGVIADAGFAVLRFEDVGEVPGEAIQAATIDCGVDSG